MKISLEQVDEVISRTGTTYEKAKEALENCDGDVLEAIILVESKNEADLEFDVTNKIDKLAKDFFEGLRELVNKGIVTKVVLMKDDKVILNIPIVAGAVGALMFTTASVVGVLTGLAAGCRLDIIKEDGEVIDICEITEETIGTLKDKLNTCKTKVSDIKNKKDKSEEEEFEVVEEEEVINLKLEKKEDDEEDK